jgi:hypothetical protein
MRLPAIVHRSVPQGPFPSLRLHPPGLTRAVFRFIFRAAASPSPENAADARRDLRSTEDAARRDSAVSPRDRRRRGCASPVQGMDADQWGSIRRGERSPMDLAAPPPAPPPAHCAGRGENSVRVRHASSRKAEFYGARCAGPLTPHPLSRKLRGRGGDASRKPGACTSFLSLQTVQSPQGDFAWLLRRSGEFNSFALPGLNHHPSRRTAALTPPPGTVPAPGAWSAGPRPPERRCRRRRGG